MENDTRIESSAIVLDESIPNFVVTQDLFPLLNLTEDVLFGIPHQLSYEEVWIQVLTENPALLEKVQHCSSILEP